VQKQRVTEIVQRFSGKIGLWEVVNEPSHCRGVKIDEPYRWAREADSKAYTCSKSKEASMKTAAATSEDAKASDKACTKSASVKTAAASSGDCPYMKANAEKSADCASKCSGVKKASDKKDAEKIDVDKTAMVDKKDNENL